MGQNWRSTKFGKQFVLCDGCVRQYPKQSVSQLDLVPHHQHNASAPNVNVSLNIQGGLQGQQPYYPQMAQPVIIQPQSSGNYQDYGQQQSVYVQQAQQQVPFTNTQIGPLQNNGIYAVQPTPLSEQKTDEGTLSTGSLVDNSNARNMDIAAAAPIGASVSAPLATSHAESTFKGTTLGHGIHIVQQGWMMKQGGLVKNWKRRYFVLKTNNVLNYYESDNSSMVKGHVPLADAIGIEKKQKKSFDVVTPKRTWSFACISTQVRDQWVESIGQVAGIR